MNEPTTRAIRRDQIPILLVHAVLLPAFTLLFVARKNYEFLMYIGVIVFFLALIIATNRRVQYPNRILWGLTAWAILHMCGGGVFLGGQRLYTIMLVPMSTRYPILRYDQFVHIVGFGVATMLMYHLIIGLLGQPPKRWVSLSIVVVMAGLGVGAVNEIVEFIATVFMPKTGVGGYVNTSLDLVADLVGALAALVWIRLAERRNA